MIGISKRPNLAGIPDRQKSKDRMIGGKADNALELVRRNMPEPFITRLHKPRAMLCD